MPHTTDSKGVSPAPNLLATVKAGLIWQIRDICSVMEVSASGYYAWRKRLTKPPCPKRKRLSDLVRDCYFENRRRYGIRRISRALGKTGVKIVRSKVRRLMTEGNLKAIHAKAFKPKTTDSKGTTAAPNLVAEINLSECAPQKIIIGDITYIRLSRRQVLLFGSVAGQSYPADHRLEFGSGDDC